jgi:hypothetical protein
MKKRRIKKGYKDWRLEGLQAGKPAGQLSRLPIIKLPGFQAFQHPSLFLSVGLEKNREQQANSIFKLYRSSLK